LIDNRYIINKFNKVQDNVKFIFHVSVCVNIYLLSLGEHNSKNLTVDVIFAIHDFSIKFISKTKFNSSYILLLIDLVTHFILLFCKFGFISRCNIIKGIKQSNL